MFFVYVFVFVICFKTDSDGCEETKNRAPTINTFNRDARASRKHIRDARASRARGANIYTRRARVAIECVTRRRNFV